MIPDNGEPVEDEPSEDGENETQLNGEPTAASSHLDPDVSKPSHSVTVRSNSETPQPQPPSDPSHTQYTQFQHKRLCERWLDNLFMVLYEDLRIYTIWRTESSQYRQQQLVYKKSPEEWEILGDLAERLHHPDEAIEAWQACLSMRFSPKAMRGILGMYERQGDSRGVVGALVRLVAWQFRWYSEVYMFPLIGWKHANWLDSSRPTCSTLSADSSRRKALSRSAASFNRPRCLNIF